MAIVEVGPIRGMRNVEGKLFVVAGPSLYRISNTGVAIPAGPIPGVGRVSMAHNQKGLANELLTVNGSAGYVYNTNTEVLAKITDTGYPGAVIADYIDQYLAQVEPQGRFWFHSDLADAFSYNTLDRYEAEGDPDRIMSLLVSHREVLVFGRETIEPFVNTGGATGTFERASNTVIECGCSARFSVRKMDNSAFWLDDKRVVRRLDGYTPLRISTAAIEAALDECSAAEIAQAYAFTWEPRGHKVYYLTVPGRFTFGYDVMTGQWHRRSSFGMPHWCVTDVVFWNGQWIAGDSRSSRLYVLDWKYKFDGTDELVRERTTGKLWNAQNPITLNSVELLFDVGGDESVPVAFPDQPTGPSISGEAPDGEVGETFSFAYTTTPGDAPIAHVSLVNTALPDGWFWDEQTATISNPEGADEPGTISLKMRAIDANGLWEEHEDQIVVWDNETPSYDDLFRWKTEEGGPSNTNDYSSPGYDDSAWEEDRGGFGNITSAGLAGHDLNTPVAGASGRIIWLRKEFPHIPGRSLRIDVYHDDGEHLFWNGEERELTTVQYFHSYCIIDGSDVLPTNTVALKVTDCYDREGNPVGSPNIYAALEISEYVIP